MCGCLETLVWENVAFSYPGTEPVNFPGAAEYTGRIIAITGQHDVPMMAEGCQGQYEAVLDHYLRVGLKPSRHDPIWVTDLAVGPLTMDLGERPIAPFLMTLALGSVFNEASWALAARQADNKNWAVRLFQEVGASHPETICFAGGDADQIRMDHFTHPWRFKPARGATNIGQASVESVQDLCNKVSEGDLSRPFQLQKPVAVKVEGSIQLQICNREVVVQAITGQHVDCSGHRGNFFPFNRLRNQGGLTREAVRVGRQLAWMGFKGDCSLDFLVDDAGQHYFTEINPRRTGCTVPMRVAQQLGAPFWDFKQVKTLARSVSDLDLQASPVFARERGKGCVLVNAFPMLAVGKVGVLMCAQSPGDLLGVMRETAELLEAPQVLDIAA